MSYALALDIEEITLSDRLPDGCDPAVFHRSMLDDVNRLARDYRWQGVTICHVVWSKDTRILSYCCRPGDRPATLHFLKQVIQAQKTFIPLSEGAGK